MSNHRIQPLPPEVAAKINSSTSITHLNGVLVELVKNALDAHARTIFVTVNYQRGGCVVDDDGDGIPPAEFKSSGGLGKAHHTSRLHSQTDVYGQRGQFLASLSSLALLTITSRHTQHPRPSTIIFHHSTPVARLIPSPTHHELRFSSHGTSVTVNDLFGNMPVRVKSRAHTLEKPDELERQWDELRQLLVSFMISNNCLTKLVISDVDRERKIVIRPQIQYAQADNDLDLLRISSILAQAGLTNSPSSHSWHTVSASVPQFSIKAALSLTPCPTRKVQFISLGIHPVFPRNQANILYTEVNRLFALSDFSTLGNSSPITDETSQNGQLDGHVSTSARAKAINRWPMFYICIKAREIRRGGEDLPESSQSLQHIVDVLSAMVNEFLRQHNMRPRAGKSKRKASPSKIPQATDKLESTSHTVSSTEETLGGHVKLPSFMRPISSPHFRDWSRVKSAKSHSMRPRLDSLRSTDLTRSTDMAPHLSTLPPIVITPALSEKVTEGADSPAKNMNTGETKPPPVVHDRRDHMEALPETDMAIPWIDPYTGRPHLVNSRTGQSVSVESPGTLTLPRRPRSTGSIKRTPRQLDDPKRPSSAILDVNQDKWVETLLDKWKNPVFCRSEQPIASLNIAKTFDGLGLEARVQNSAKLSSLDFLGASVFRGKLRKQDLITAEAIAQVDQKFVLIKMETAVSMDPYKQPGLTLALIDQHAADERCRVEQLFEGLFQTTDGSISIHTIQVDPIIFEIPANETSMFSRHATFFSRWGVQYTLEPGVQGNKTLVRLTRLPSLIAERSRLEPDLLINLIRGEIWGGEENGRGRPKTPPRFSASNESNSWVDRLAGCPQGILDLLNSRACRTAIMFNDALSIPECQNLVGRLAQSVFPFQCAHGRPSMVPIVDLCKTFDDNRPDEYGDEDIGFVGAFKRWQTVG